MSTLTEPATRQKILADKNEAAQMLSISVREIDAARARGDLGAVKYGTKVLFHVAELQRFAESLPSAE